MDWDNFTPQEFLEYCKEKYTENIVPKLCAFTDGLYNISTWLEKSIRPTKPPT